MRLSHRDQAKASIILVLTAVVAVMAGVQSDTWWPTVVIAAVGLLAYAVMVSSFQRRSNRGQE